MIIEPVTSNGNHMATPYYYKRLRAMAAKHEIPFVVNETKTGLGSSGKMWAHEHWYLSQSPDIVTFGGKTGLSGFYANYDMGVSEMPVTQEIDMVKMVNYGIIW